MSTKTRISAIALTALIGASGAIGVTGASAAGQVANMPSDYYYCLTTTANARSGPGTDYGVIKTYRAGRRVRLVREELGWSSQLQDDVWWGKLRQGGWVRSDFLGDC